MFHGYYLLEFLAFVTIAGKWKFVSINNFTVHE